MTGLTYLASPYSHPDPAERQRRFEATCREAGRLMKRGMAVFSPIAHSHPIEQNFHDGKQEGHEFWLAQDFAVLRHCERLIVLRLEGWEASRGVAAEVEFAGRIGIPVLYIDPT